MATLTPAQIAAVANGAGFSGDSLVWAVAVALAESGGRTDAVGVNADGSRDRGLWQINNKWHPDVTDAMAFDPAQAAAAAYRISKSGTSWSPWAAYTNGAAAGHLSRARVAVAQTGDGAPAEQATGGPAALGPVDVVGALGSLAKSAAAIASTWIKAAEWISDGHNWMRIMEVTGGVVLVTVAVITLGKTGAGPVAGGINAVTAAPGKAVRAATSIVPAGKLLK